MARLTLNEALTAIINWSVPVWDRLKAALPKEKENRLRVYNVYQKPPTIIDKSILYVDENFTIDSDAIRTITQNGLVFVEGTWTADFYVPETDTSLFALALGSAEEWVKMHRRRRCGSIVFTSAMLTGTEDRGTEGRRVINTETNFKFESS